MERLTNNNCTKSVLFNFKCDDEYDNITVYINVAHLTTQIKEKKKRTQYVYS